MGPKELFDNPKISFICSSYFEGQHFERKRQRKANQLAETISAFANTNREGGVIVLGVENDGIICGISHFGIQWENNLFTSLARVIHYENYETSKFPCINKNGKPDQILLIYVNYSENRVIELTNGNAFKRVGDQTIQMTREQVIQLMYSKGQINFEDEMVIELENAELDEDVVKEFIEGVKQKDGLMIPQSQEAIIQSKRLAIERNGKLYLTNAGLLVLGKDPCSKLPGAKLRFLRYSGKTEKTGIKLNIIKDISLEGPIPRVILKAHELIKTQVKEFSYLNENGQFVIEMEYPEPVWLEAIVNAIAHRSYALKNATILVKMFDDRFVVESPGGFPGDVTPNNFYSYPRNARIMEALKYFGYVKAISEGTKRMYFEMEQSDLPPPEFKEESNFVIVSLFNDLIRRKGEWEKSTGQIEVNQYGNLFKITITDRNTFELKRDISPNEIWSLIRETFVNKLRDKGWIVDDFGHRAYHRDNPYYELDNEKLQIAGLYRAFRYRFVTIGNQLYFVVDPAVEVENKLSLFQILQIHKHPEDFEYTYGRKRNSDIKVKILDIKDSMVEVNEDGHIYSIYTTEIIPHIKTYKLNHIIEQMGIDSNLEKESKRLSLLTVKNPSRKRLNKTIEIIDNLKADIFPLEMNSLKVDVNNTPVKAVSPQFQLKKDLRESSVSFDPLNRYKSDTVIQGLFKYGSYDKPQEIIHLIPLTTKDQLKNMESLIDLLIRGSFRYQGVERTFGIKIIESGFHITEKPEEYLLKCKDIISNLDKTKNYFFFVYCPEKNYSRTDYNAPYYQVKKYLFEQGYNSQMVDEETLIDPRYKDLNLALDIFAKAGYVPWVLAEGIPDIDLFLGFSFSSISDKTKQSRVLGYVNVFDEFGRWKFYHGNSRVFSFDERKKHFCQLIEDTILRLKKEKHLKKICIHHSYRLSRDIRESIYDTISSLCPNPEVQLIWINDHTPIRFYDKSSVGDGSLARGNYIITSPNQFYLSTTGYNQLNQQAIGTPKILEVNVDAYPEHTTIDLKIVAQQILSLTKLNWASSKTFCHLPITLKFANDIAYLMNAIMRGSGSFNLNPALHDKPWFL